MSSTIFMIHGMMVGPWCWDNYRNFFEEKGYRCITPVLRFHDMDPAGIPDPRLGTTSLLDYIADLEEEIAGLQERPILMGHSMGGLLAQILASRGYAEAAVLLTPASPAGINALSFTVLKSFSGAMMNWGFWKKPFRFSFTKAVYSCMHLLPCEEQKQVYGKMVYESSRAARQIGYWYLDRTKAARVDHDAVSCPMLVIAGKEDRITPAPVVKKVAHKYKDAAFKMFDDKAHWVLGEPGWQDVAAYVSGWLKDNSL
jgi:non-heme chloroperoxidase